MLSRPMGNEMNQQIEENRYTKSWILFIVCTHIVFIGQLYYYSGSGGFIWIFPSAFVLFSLLGIITLVGNSWFAWQYLGKPDLSEIFERGPEEEPLDGDV